MPLQYQLANTTLGVPYSYALVMGTSHNPSSVIGEERSGTNVILDNEGFSVKITGQKKKATHMVAYKAPH